MPTLPVPVFPISSKPFGFTYGEWSAKWWQWLFSIPRSRNPAFDRTGDYAHINQVYPNIFFLCQTYEGTMGTMPIRTVTLPSCTAVFMPIINWISILHHDGESDQELVEIADQRMDVIENLYLSINGTIVDRGLEKFRVRSQFFDIVLPEDNIISSQAITLRAVSDGYWLFFEPIKSGTKLTSIASCSSGQTKIGVTYNLLTQSDPYL